MITNFNKCELGASYQVNSHELIIARISTKTSGKCTHNIYHGTIDGKQFTGLNSPKLKGLLGMNTLQPRTPRPKRKQKQNYAAPWHAKANILFNKLTNECGESDDLRHAFVLYLNQRTNEMRHQEEIDRKKAEEDAKRKKENSAELKAIKKARIKRLNEYINSYDSRIVELMAKDITAAQMMMLNKEERIERARRLIAEIGG